MALSTSFVFAIYILNSCGGVVGYFLTGSGSRQQAAEKAHISRIVIFRGFLAFLFVAVVQMPVYGTVLATIILVLIGFAYAWFLVYTLSLSMELVPSGKAGLFNALVGVGGACGSFIGPFLAQTLGFTHVFLTASAIFFLAYIAFKIFT